MGLPDNPSKDATSGDRVHLAMQGGTVELTTDEMDMVSRLQEQELTTKMVVFGDAPINEVHREKRLWSSLARWSGKADVLMISGSTGLIIDYKTGRNAVEKAKTNQQLKGLAVLAQYNWKLDRIFVAILQPHAGAPDIHSYGEYALNKARIAVNALIRRALRPNQPLHIGESQCRYCKAQGVCPELKAEAVTLSGINGASITNFNGGQISDLLRRAGPVEGFIEALKKRAKELLAQDESSVPGWSLGKGRVTRKITQSLELYKVLADHGVPFDDILQAVRFSLKRVDELVGIFADKKGIADDVEALIERSQSDSILERQNT